MRQFKIVMAMDPESDVRSVEPLAKPRGMRNPMTDEINLTPRPTGGTAAVPPSQGGR
jgi:hypothetical protein